MQKAVEQNNTDVIKYLIPEKPAPCHIHPNTRLEDGNTVLHHAIEASRTSDKSGLELIRYLKP